MAEYLEAFALGNGAILGNVCLLPLYPGLFVLLADRTEHATAPRSLRWLGLVVLAGVITAMVAIGALLHALSTPFSEVADWVLPLMYLLVLALGVAMLVDRNPLARFTTGTIPVVQSPAGSAYLYGMALAPMTLPCTGPVIISAFVLGGVRGGGELLDGVAYFVAFSLGFGWPLVVLPLLSAPFQRRLTGFLTRHHRGVTVVSGLLLVAVAVVGWVAELGPR